MHTRGTGENQEEAPSPRVGAAQYYLRGGMGGGWVEVKVREQAGAGGRPPVRQLREAIIEVATPFARYVICVHVIVVFVIVLEEQRRHVVVDAVANAIRSCPAPAPLADAGVGVVAEGDAVVGERVDAAAAVARLRHSVHRSVLVVLGLVVAVAANVGAGLEGVGGVDVGVAVPQERRAAGRRGEGRRGPGCAHTQGGVHPEGPLARRGSWRRRCLLLRRRLRKALI
mmetsp:Transcript_685/g.1677  ORF Transcript_685/g.1677 Transcript_685/m.1677 type:complete len:227 (+) Transcript_685:185-865(+)